MRFCLFSFTATRNTILILLRPETGSVLSFITTIRPLCFHQNHRQQKLLYCRKYDCTFVVFNSSVVVTVVWYFFCEVSVMWQHFEFSCLTECECTEFVLRQRQAYTSRFWKYVTSCFCRWFIYVFVYVIEL